MYENCTKITAPWRHNTCLRYNSGVHSWYFGDFSGDTQIVAYDSEFQINAITGNSTFYRVEQNEGKAEFKQTVVVGDGASDVTYDAKIVIYGHSPAATLFANKVKNGRFSILARLNSGDYKFLGFSKPMKISAGDSTAGVAAGEFNGFNLTLSVTEIDFAPSINIAGTFSTPLVVN